MSNYNFLRAVGDGLAEAIRYRTNLKRQRREEQYNYNRDFERNENEYQRDLQRKKDWLDYTTDYDWKQMEKKDKYNRDKTLRYEKEDIDRKLGYLDELPKDIDLYSPSAVNDYNDVRGAYGLGPVAVQKKEKPYEQVLKEKEDELKLKYKYHNMQGQADLAKDKALASYRNSLAPKAKDPLQGYKDWLAYMKLEPSEENYALYRSGRYSAPRAVKGGSGNSAVMEQGGIPHFDKRLQYYQDKINDLNKKITEYENSNQYDLADYLEQRNNIEKDSSLTPEQKEEKLIALETKRQIFKKQTEDMLGRLKSDRDAAQANLDYGTRYSYPQYSASGTQFIHVPTMQSKTDSFLDGFIKEEEDKEKARNNIASNTPPLRPFVNPYDGNSMPKSIHIPFEEGLDPEQKRLYDKWNNTDSAAFYMGWDDNRRRR